MTSEQKRVLEKMRDGAVLRVDLGTFWLDGKRLSKRVARPLMNQELITRDYGGACSLQPKALDLLAEVEA